MAVFEIYIKTTPERLWEAITDPKLRARYSFGVERTPTGRPARATRPRSPASSTSRRVRT